jgi:hypothetical protein
MGMSKISILCGLLLAGLLMACSTTQTQLAGDPGVQLDPRLGVFIAVPADPADPDYAGAGKYLAYALAEDLGKRGVSIGIGKEHATQEQNLAAAKQQGAAYLMVADITDWQRHETELNFIPSSAAFTMTVLKVADGSQLRSDDLVKQGSRISFTGGTDPKDQMKAAMADYVDRVYPEQ